jgi:hypothetical protein
MDRLVSEAAKKILEVVTNEIELKPFIHAWSSVLRRATADLDGSDGAVQSLIYTFRKRLSRMD